MTKTNKILAGIIVVLLVAVVGLVVWREWFLTPSYYAVYLRTGDLYFGKLARFPSFGLKNVYLLRVDNTNAQNPLTVQKFSDVFWGPADYLKINRDEVVWTTELNPEGQLARILASNPSLTNIPASQPPVPASQPPVQP